MAFNISRWFSAYSFFECLYEKSGKRKPPNFGISGQFYNIYKIWKGIEFYWTWEEVYG